MNLSVSAGSPKIGESSSQNSPITATVSIQDSHGQRQETRSKIIRNPFSSQIGKRNEIQTAIKSGE